MAINYQIPTQARYMPTSTIFSATFNAYTPATYDFTSTPANQNINVLLLQPGTVYLISRISAGGNVAEAQYLESIQTFPEVTIKKSISRQTVYQRSIPIVNYFDGLEAGAWVISDKNNDWLTLSCSGILNQLPSMVGLGTAKIQISLSIFAIESAYFASAFRDQQTKTMGQLNRG